VMDFWAEVLNWNWFWCDQKRLFSVTQDVSDAAGKARLASLIRNQSH
jgi:hypothetical protein